MSESTKRGLRAWDEIRRLEAEVERLSQHTCGSAWDALRAENNRLRIDMRVLEDERDQAYIALKNAGSEIDRLRAEARRLRADYSVLIEDNNRLRRDLHTLTVQNARLRADHPDGGGRIPCPYCDDFSASWAGGYDWAKVALTHLKDHIAAEHSEEEAMPVLPHDDESVTPRPDEESAVDEQVAHAAALLEEAGDG